MKTIVEASRPSALLQSHSVTLTRYQNRNSSRPPSAVLNGNACLADLQNPWEHAAWIMLGVVSLLLLLLTFGLS
ncbi:MAG TPA: hypothetical protein VL361_04520 [Candidatus Limnocylindrales bacterium]|nr:hypothetical protein [Candidatus Limnocylindrales bacterium]